MSTGLPDGIVPCGMFMVQRIGGRNSHPGLHRVLANGSGLTPIALSDNRAAQPVASSRSIAFLSLQVAGVNTTMLRPSEPSTAKAE